MNDATTTSSNEIVKLIRNDDTTAGSRSGNVIDRNVVRAFAPRSRDASSSHGGILRGARRAPDTSPLPKKRRRTRTIDAGIASTTVATAVTRATYPLAFRAEIIAEFRRHAWYQRNVKPS